MEIQVWSQVIYFPLKHAPGIIAFAPIVAAEERRWDANQMRGKVGAAEVGRGGRFSEKFGPVQGAVADSEEDFAAAALGERESRGC